jgi:hypothetical protein
MASANWLGKVRLAREDYVVASYLKVLAIQSLDSSDCTKGKAEAITTGAPTMSLTGEGRGC